MENSRKNQFNVTFKGTNYGMFNDLGVYGVPRAVRERKRFDAVTAMRKMEEYTRSVGGYHFLYADTFLTRHVEKYNKGHNFLIKRIQW
jgi:hypothetical protein